jgi:hypothetical protein
MSVTLEQKYYEFLTRTDHPVFARDYSSSTGPDSPLNSVLNRVMARQMVRLRAEIDRLSAITFPQNADVESIGKWEERYFGFSKSATVGLSTRVAQLMLRIQSRISMSAPQAIAISQAITGLTPTIIRNLHSGGWVLGQSVLGVSTIFSGSNQSSDSQLYLVVFSSQVSSDLITILDNELTRIEKGGSRHIIVTPPPHWILGTSVLGVDTVLG